MPRSFQYVRPNTLREACELKAEHGPQAAFWAGGTDLLLDWRRGASDFEYCIDLSYLTALRYIHQADRSVSIGALTTIASLGAYKSFEYGCAILLDVARQFATPQIRCIATIGGNLCHAVPSADYATPLIALDADLKLVGVGGERTLSLEKFFTGARQTALQHDELLAEIGIPPPPPGSASSFQRVARSAVDIALVNAAVRLTVDGEQRIADARIVLGAVAPVPLRSRAAEDMLRGERVCELGEALLDQVSERAAADTRTITDLRTSAAYRKHVSGVLVKRGLEQVVRQLKGRDA